VKGKGEGGENPLIWEKGKKKRSGNRVLLNEWKRKHFSLLFDGPMKKRKREEEKKMSFAHSLFSPEVGERGGLPQRLR